MMNPSAASASGGENPYAVAPGNPVLLPPTPSLFLPIMDQLESSSFLGSAQLNSSNNMEANIPTLLDPASNAVADNTSHYVHHHDTLQFYPPAPTPHYLAACNNYNTYLPTLQEYYFPTLLEENIASFGAAPQAQLGLDYGYRAYYFPRRGGYACGHHPPRCQVDGCMVDLSKAKRYHRRHRVCENHSKAPFVITAGAIMPQRFCQQCSRFHEVDAFDDEKKSCRQRHADHNRRRRKPKLSGTDVTVLKRRAHAKKSAIANKEASSSKNMDTGDILGTKDMGSASKEHGRSMGLGEVAREQVDPKGKGPMKQQAACIPQQNILQGFPFMLSPAGSSTGTCLPQNQQVSGGNTSQVQEPCLAFDQHHQHGNIILQLGQAVFDLDFDL